MYVIGLTGCAGSGKSFVCDCARRSLGIPVIDSDTECRLMQVPGTKMFDDMVAEFGTSILTEDGQLNRAALAAIVFADKEALLRLNAITHPAVIAHIKELIKEYEKNGEEFVFVESALAKEAGYKDFCDELWLVYSNDETRAERLRSTRGYSDEKIASLFASQVPQTEMFDVCDRVIDNGTGADAFGIVHQIGYYLRDIRKRLNTSD